MSDALVAALAEIERYVAQSGWDQPARLFALVSTAELIAAEPSLGPQLSRPGGIEPDALSSIEQEGFHGGEDILDALALISWPPTVSGVAIALERLFLPATLEAELPADADDAAAFVAQHPERQDVRVITGVLRDEASYALARLRSNPDELLAGADLVPGLAAALSRTLSD